MTFDVAMTLPTGLPRFPGAFTRGVAILTACQSAVVFRVYPQGGEPVESKSQSFRDFVGEIRKRPHFVESARDRSHRTQPKM